MVAKRRVIRPRSGSGRAATRPSPRVRGSAKRPAAVHRTAPTRIPDAPAPFGITRDLPPGSYPLSRVFPGFQEAPPCLRSPAAAGRAKTLAQTTLIQVVPDEAWMYVAPLETPPWADLAGWHPFTTPSNCIVVGRKHLAESPSITLYLDICHEFMHILQRDAGRELWDVSVGYVDSPTELEAYRFSVAEARRLGVPDSFLRQYLEVEWVTAEDHLRLLKHLGVEAADPPVRRGRQ